MNSKNYLTFQKINKYIYIYNILIINFIYYY